MNRMKGWSLAIISVFSAAGLAGCGTAAPKTPSTGPAHGVASVAYAGSLQDVNDQQIGPAFAKATGNTYQGQGGGSLGIAQQIKSKTIAPNVFESVGYAPIQVIEPQDTRWAVAFAASPLVLAYNPHSRFAPTLNAIRSGREPLKNLFKVLATPGFRLGRTNPNTDPQGQAFYMMVELAVKQYHWPAADTAKILGSVDNPHEVYSEEGILTLLQAGNLDATSAFLSEAVQRHLDYIPLPASLNFANPRDNHWYRQASIALSDGTTVHGEALTVDVTTVGKPTAPAISFIHFLLGSQGSALMKKNGYVVFAPEALGSRPAMPQTIRKLVP